MVWVQGLKFPVAKVASMVLVHVYKEAAEPSYVALSSSGAHSGAASWKYSLLDPLPWA